MSLPPELTAAMATDSIFAQGHGLLDPEASDLRQGVELAAGYLLVAGLALEAPRMDTETAQCMLRVADRTTRALADEIQTLMGSRVSLSQSMGLARSLVEADYARQRAEHEATIAGYAA